MEPTPLIRIVRGAPTSEELAALVGVLLSRNQAAPELPVPVVSRWATSARPTDGPHPGPGAWRASALPG